MILTGPIMQPLELGVSKEQAAIAEQYSRGIKGMVVAAPISSRAPVTGKTCGLFMNRDVQGSYNYGPWI